MAQTRWRSESVSTGPRRSGHVVAETPAAPSVSLRVGGWVTKSAGAEAANHYFKVPLEPAGTGKLAVMLIGIAPKGLSFQSHILTPLRSASGILECRPHVAATHPAVRAAT